MAGIPAVIGLQTVLNNLRNSQHRMAQDCQKGLRKAGLMLQRESQRRVPVEYGPLKASAYTRSRGNGFQTNVFVGYTSAYALPVHEKVQMKLKGQPRPSGKGNYWDPQDRGQAKFLEGPVREMRAELRKVILDAVRIRLR